MNIELPHTNFLGVHNIFHTPKYIHISLMTLIIHTPRILPYVNIVETVLSGDVC